MTGEAQRAIQALGLPQKVTSIADVPELQTFERKMGQKVIDGTGPFSFDLIVDKMNYHQHKLLFLDATDALVTAAQVRTACSEIKIDVDGNEHKIIEGMSKTLGDKRLKSIAVETNLKIGAHKQLEKFLCSFGFRLLNESRYVNAEYEKVGTPNHFFLRDP